MLDGVPAPLPQKKGEAPPQFLAHVYCCQRAGWIKMALGMGVGLAAGTLCYVGTELPFSKRGHSPQFSAHFYCGETAGCINMPIGTVVGLNLGDIVLDGDTAPLF